MKTYEELKAMTMEDLVAYAMKQQDNAESLKKDKEQLTKWWDESNTRLHALKNAISNLSQLA